MRLRCQYAIDLFSESILRKVVVDWNFNREQGPSRLWWRATSINQPKKATLQYLSAVRHNIIDK